MKIGVIGSGDVGQVLASGFLKHGHRVMIGARDPAKLAAWAKANAQGRVASFADAANFGKVVVLAASSGRFGPLLNRVASARRARRLDRVSWRHSYLSGTPR